MEESIWVSVGAMKNPLSKYTLALLKAQRRIENSQLALSNIELEELRIPKHKSTVFTPGKPYSRKHVEHAEMMAKAFRDDANYYREKYKRERAECTQLKRIAFDIAQRMEVFAQDTLSLSVEQYKPI